MKTYYEKIQELKEQWRNGLITYEEYVKLANETENNLDDDCPYEGLIIL